MFRQSEIKEMKKGFHPSRTGDGGNRRARREHLQTKGLHNPKKRIGRITTLVIRGQQSSQKVKMFNQIIDLKDGSKKIITHTI